MARGRMIDASIWDNEKVCDLPPMARLLLIGLITTADDQGRLTGHPRLIRCRYFPFDDDVTDDNVVVWLDMLEVRGSIILYTSNGKQFIQLANWWKYQSILTPSPSEYPSPNGWEDRSRNRIENEENNVYLMLDESTGFYKIGRSINPAKRELTLQSQKPTIRLLARAKHNKRFEARLHQEFKEKRVRGEWFSLSQLDVEYILNALKSEANNG